MLGVYYEQGSGIPKDQAEAVKWYRKASEQGNAAAQYRLKKTWELMFLLIRQFEAEGEGDFIGGWG